LLAIDARSAQKTRRRNFELGRETGKCRNESMVIAWKGAPGDKTKEKGRTGEGAFKGAQPELDLEKVVGLRNR